MERFRTKEQQADHELRQLLGNGNVNGEEHKTQKWGTVPGIRGRVRPQIGKKCAFFSIAKLYKIVSIE